MSIQLNFSDRFSYPEPNGIPGYSADQMETLTEAQILEAAPELSSMVDIVRRSSVLLRRKTALEIFKIITFESDPRIALVLASAKRRSDSTYLFQGLVQVQEVMFASTTRGVSGQTNRTLFSDGIKRVSAMLTASVLIGQLAQVSEQAEHAKVLEKQALEDLDRVCLTYELSGSTSSGYTAEIEEQPSFIFNSGNLTLAANESIRCSWYATHLTNSWVELPAYTGPVTPDNPIPVWRIVSDIADSINQVSVLYEGIGLVASVQLAGKKNEFYSNTHLLRFYPRSANTGLTTFSLNFRIQKYTGTVPSNPNVAPFVWGININSLTNNIINGLIFVLKDSKTATLSAEQEIEPQVLYIRNRVQYVAGGSVPPTTAKVKYRLQFWSPNEIIASSDFEEITIIRKVDEDQQKQLDLDNSRYSQVAVELLQAITTERNYSGMTGALVKNDPLFSYPPEAAIELIAWTLSRLNVYVVLDILELPIDIEIATGNLVNAYSIYSNNPKSVRVEARTLAGGAIINNTSFTQPPLLSTQSKRSSIVRNIEDEVKNLGYGQWPQIL